MKFVKSAFIALVLTASAPVFAANQPGANRPNGVDIMYDVFLRPAGFVATILGAGLYLALTPANAITSLQPPHDTFKTSADFMIMNPYKFTFTRPVGDYNFPQTEK